MLLIRNDCLPGCQATAFPTIKLRCVSPVCTFCLQGFMNDIASILPQPVKTFHRKCFFLIEINVKNISFKGSYFTSLYYLIFRDESANVFKSSFEAILLYLFKIYFEVGLLFLNFDLIKLSSTEKILEFNFL